MLRQPSTGTGGPHVNFDKMFGETSASRAWGGGGGAIALSTAAVRHSSTLANLGDPERFPSA